MAQGMKNIKFIPWATICGVFANTTRYIIKTPPPPKPIAPISPDKNPAIIEIILFI